MSKSLYFFILLRIVVFFTSLAVTSEIFSNAHEFFGDTYIDMDDKKNWEWDYGYRSDQSKQIRRCASHFGVQYYDINHWHWSWAHVWAFWGSMCILALNLISIITSIEKKTLKQ